MMAVTEYDWQALAEKLRNSDALHEELQRIFRLSDAEIETELRQELSKYGAEFADEIMARLDDLPETLKEDGVNG
jgi:hypothetical protein